MRMTCLRRFATAALALAAAAVVAAATAAAGIVEPGPYLSCVGDDGVTISWITSTASGSNYVEWGPTKALGNRQASYQDVEAVEDSGRYLVHSTRIKGLKAATEYYYRVVSGEDTNDDDGAPWSFRTFPPDGTKNFRFAVYGDTRYGGENARNESLRHKRVLRGIAGEDVGLILHVGDIAALTDNLIEWSGQHPLSGDPQGEFFRTAGGAFHIMQSKWIAVTKGNHEVMGRYRRIYEKIFEQPCAANGLGTNKSEAYYAFDYGSARIISLEHNGSTGFDYEGDPTREDQYHWLVGELENAQRAGKWIFVVVHQPPFVPDTDSTSKYNNGFMWSLQEYIVPLFQRYNVAMVFSGHNHVTVVWKKPLLYKGRGAGSPVIEQVDEGVRYQIQGADTADLHMADRDGNGKVETWVYDDQGSVGLYNGLKAAKYNLDVYAAGADANREVLPTYCIVEVKGDVCTVTTKGMYNSGRQDNENAEGKVLNIVKFERVSSLTPTGGDHSPMNISEYAKIPALRPLRKIAQIPRAIGGRYIWTCAVPGKGPR